MMGECRGSDREWFPMQFLVNDKGSDAAVLAFDVVGPGEVKAELGGETFEVFERVGGWVED